jgi:L-ribulose-5-phosphate 4-epimerase
MWPPVSENGICGSVGAMVRVHDLSAVRRFEVDGFAQPFEVVKGAGQNNGNRLIHEVIMGEQEGVIKFELDHIDAPLPAELMELLGPLLGWRRVMFDLGMVGQHAVRYGGLGYGNVSVRVDATGSFLVSGSQTSGLKEPTAKDFACVESFDHEAARIVSHGKVRPSSESMTHAVLYKTNPDIRCVLHAHDPVIWDNANGLGLSSTPEEVEYGTSEMVSAVQAIARRLGGVGVFSMGGHRDGIIAFGRNEDEAGKRLVAVRARAHEMEYRCLK